MKTNKISIRLAASLGVAALIAAPSSYAALSVTAGGTGTALSASELVDILIPVNSGINVVGGSETFAATAWHNATGTKVAGAAGDIQDAAIGSFQGATPSVNGLAFSSGVLLTTGSIGGTGPDYQPEMTGALAPNDSGRTSVSWSSPLRPGSTTLESATGATNTRDASWLSFRFTSDGDAFSFQYVFASDEYGHDDDLQAFNDSFAFVLTDLTDNSQINLAVLPGNTPVSVANVNSTTNAGYYTDNPVGDELDNTDSPYQIEYDGLAGGYGATPLFAYADIVAGREYRIDIVIADTVDRLGDSAVFLAADSFVSNPVPEPATYIGALALGGLIARRLRRK